MNVDARPVFVEGSPAPWSLGDVLLAVRHGRLGPATRVSLDGREWIPAGILTQRMAARGDDALAFVAPVGRTESWSVVAGYVGVFSLLFFGGPLSFVGGMVLTAGGTATVLVRLVILLASLVLGPLPPALLALLGLRALRRDPTYRGKGRAIVALVTSALMVVIAVAGAVVGLSTDR